MSEVAFKLTKEIVIPCPVCGASRLFVDPEITIGEQISFFCNSKKCGGKKRHIKKTDLQKYIDKYHETSVQCLKI